MPFSVVMPDGTVKDIVYQKRKTKDLIIYHAYLGKELLGQLSQSHKRWSAVIMHKDFDSSTALGLVDGFSTRYDAVSYMLYALGYWKRP